MHQVKDYFSGGSRTPQRFGSYSRIDFWGGSLVPTLVWLNPGLMTYLPCRLLQWASNGKYGTTQRGLANIDTYALTDQLKSNDILRFQVDLLFYIRRCRLVVKNLKKKRVVVTCQVRTALSVTSSKFLMASLNSIASLVTL
jgi:hypothetical protein